MNYRHAFHAGNFADCVKHAILVAWLRLLRRKETPFVVLDTHAGAGRFSLASDAAGRTGEWRGGIGRLLEGEVPAALADYVGVVRGAGFYPGSPAIAQALLRPQDGLIACELHPEECALLRTAMAGDGRCAVHQRDGYAAIGALLPPRAARRGMVLIDPPFEAPGEFERMAGAIRSARARFPAGGVMAWYPIKGRAPARMFHAALAGLRDVVAFEFCLRAPLAPDRLNGCGLVAVGAPFGLEDAAAGVLAALLDRLGTGEEGQEVRMVRLAGE